MRPICWIARPRTGAGMAAQPRLRGARGAAGRDEGVGVGERDLGDDVVERRGIQGAERSGRGAVARGLRRSGRRPRSDTYCLSAYDN